MFVTPMPASELETGDVLMYRVPVEDRRVVAHRVVEIVEAGDQPVVRTKGDPNNGPDSWVARLETEPLWRVQAAVPYAGYASKSCASPSCAPCSWPAPGC